MQKKAIFNWSGGKDSAFALGEIFKNGEYEIPYLMTSIGSKTRRVSMHGVREELLVQQAKAIGIPLHLLELPESPDMETYEKTLLAWMKDAKQKGIDYSIFGDIFLEDLRAYRESQLEKLEFRGVFPLWKRDTTKLIHEFIDQGFKSIITAIDNSKLSKDFVGQVIDEYLIKQLPANVDPCGENGEFHSFVYSAPYFKNDIGFTKGDIVLKEYKLEDKTLSHAFWFCDLLPQLKQD